MLETDNLPNFKLKSIPDVRIKSIHFQNYKTFENYTFDFSNENNQIKDFICFIGPNGYGKSTILNAIQLIFTRFEGRSLEKIRAGLEKCVRHIGTNLDGVYGNDDFIITAQIQSSIGNYEIQINKNGFIKDHPPLIKEIVYRLCYFARFDQDLYKIQIARDKWPRFKELYEIVTGFALEENMDIERYFGGTSDPSLKRLMKEYVLAFFVKKPSGTINDKECSDGERKIIKSFSTLLTLEYTPQIILVDNIEMHVERGRHMALIESMKKCFPYSQIFSTTHSYYISKANSNKYGIYDLRLVSGSNIIKREPWRLCIIDEINDGLVKLKMIGRNDDNDSLVELGKKLLIACENDINDLQKFKDETEKFLKEVTRNFINGVIL